MAFTMPLIFLISLICILTQSYGFVADYPEEPHLLANPLHNRIPNLHPTNGFDHLHKQIEEAHKHKVEKPHLKVLRPATRPVIRPFHPLTSGIDVDQRTYYGGLEPAPMIPYQYVEPMYRPRPHMLPGYSHLLPPLMPENRDYLL